jgi:hypothetical protein
VNPRRFNMAPPSRRNRFSELLLSGVLVFISVTPVVVAQSPIFNGPRNYPVGYPAPTGTSDFVFWTVADFNGDGLLDIAVANNGPNNVSILLQNPDGTFQPAVNYAVGNAPTFINTGDVNGDGKVDIVVVNSADNTLGVLLGNGDGTFQAQVTTPLPVSGTSSTTSPYIVVGDWNGDGKTDVALAGQLPQAGQYAIAVMLSNGGGTFQTPVTYSLSAPPFALNTADFNGDGKLDLVTADMTSGLSVWLGNGNGTFQTAIITKPPQSFYSGTPLVIADFNQDGHPDIAAATMGVQADESVPNLTLFLGNGNGGFESTVFSSLQYVPYAAGDLNGDGKPDLMVSTGIGTFVSFLNSGNATFTVGPSITLDEPDDVPVGVSTIVLADLNGNGKLDLVTGFDSPESPGLVSVIYGNGDGSFAQFPIYNANVALASSPDYSTLVAADFNNDGKPDLATAFLGPEGYLNVSVLLNDGAGFSAPTITVSGSRAAPSYLVAANFKLNGPMDVAIAQSGLSGGGVLVLLGNGNGTFQPAIEYGQQMFGPLVVGDFNGDGNPDILGPGGNGTVSVLLGNGDGTFGFPVNSTLTTTSGVGSPVVADFNGDGKLDIAALVGGNPESGVPSQIQIFFGNGDGTFSAGSTTYNAGTNPFSIATGDVNGDGIPDLVILNNCCTLAYLTAPSAVVVLLGNGDGTFQSPITTVTDDGLGVNFLAISDLNLDGKADVVYFDGYGTSLLLGNGNGTFQTPLQYFLGTGVTALAIADFDGNGAPDLAANGGPLGISLLLNAAGSNAPAALLSPAMLAFGSVATGQSASLTATLTNMATTALSISGITISGGQSSGFSQTNSCGTSLAAGLSCTITATFAPQALAASAATIQISDSASNSPQTISLSGTGAAAPSIGLVLASGSSSSVTVSPGHLAVYALSIGGAGMSGTATVTCTGAPKNASCIVVSPIAVSATSASTINIQVATTAGSTASMNGHDAHFGSEWIGILFGVVLMPMPWWKRRVSKGIPLGALIVLLMILCSCGSSSPIGSTGPTGTAPGANGTPAGSYTLTVTATLNSVTQSVTLGLVVQ